LPGRCAALPTIAPGQPQPTGYDVSVEKTARAFASFEEADEADARYDAAMSTEERH
jgi:hypothetical protein